jgi:eukaryotic-like serine/threonine-protein kinase
LLVLVGAIAAATAWMLKPVEARPVMRFTHRLGEETFSRTGRPVLAISRDGRRLVYVAGTRLYLRNLDEANVKPIPGTDENPSSPFFSPDGEWVGFWSSNGSLKKIRIAGGTPVELTKAGNPLGVSWGLDDTIVYALNDGIWRVSGNGGVAEHLIKTAAGERIHAPQMLPGGKAVLVTATTGTGADGWDEGRIVVVRLDSGERTVVHTGGAYPRYVSTGHIVYVLKNTLFALPFDLETLQVRGGPVPVVQDVRRAIGADIGIAQYAISDAGSLVYIKGGDASRVSLALADRTGNRKPLSGSTAYAFHPRFNYDDSRIAVHRVDDGNPNVWIFEVAQAQWRQLTFNGGERPAWTPDGRAITYRSVTSLWQIPSDFSGAAVQLPGTDAPGNLGPFAWSPDGGVLLYGATDGLHAFRPKAAASGTPDKDTLIMKVPAGAALISRASFSTDGRWIVYTAVASDPYVYVTPFPVGVGGHRKILNESVNSPIWRRDEIFFASLTGTLQVLGIRTQPALDWTNPRTLFTVQGVTATAQGTTNYDVTRDGKQILLVIPDDQTRGQTQEIQVVLNWYEELKRQVP